ncbi:hypothetical protein CAP36_14020 [Chitinophagaceae bacterium IBVUCB2]|nr:hypothetical protein CAP36_14020 [Chitinophagaceae bacterium IBVUCB2]
MKKIFLSAVAICGLLIAEAQLKTPAPSPAQTIKQDFGVSTVELSYSRPAMKGRKIFGDLVPFGNVWRTGANQATVLTFGDDVTIGGTKIKAGKYGLLSIPEKNSWTLIITKQLDVTSPAAYKQDQDVVRTEVKTIGMDESMENFTMQFANIKSNSCELHIMWDKTAVILPITTDVETKVMAQIDQLMNKDNRPYFNAAMYYMDNGKDLNQALTWFDKAIEMQPTAFWIHHQRANCLAKLGRKADAKAAAEKSKELATAAKNNDYVELNNKLLAELK